MFAKVFKQHVSICRLTGIDPPTASQAAAVCAKLGSFRLLLVENGRNDLYQRIRLNVSQDDVAFALRDIKS